MATGHHTTIPPNQFQKDYLAFSHNISLFFLKKEDLSPSPRMRHKIGFLKKRANGFDLNSFWAHFRGASCIHWQFRFNNTVAVIGFGFYSEGSELSFFEHRFGGVFSTIHCFCHNRKHQIYKYLVIKTICIWAGGES